MIYKPPFVDGLKFIVGEAVSTTEGVVPTLTVAALDIAELHPAADTTTL